MNSMVEVRAVVRREHVAQVVGDLKRAGVPRLTVYHAHAIGAGVDPAHIGEEGAYLDRAVVQFVCAGDRCAMCTELIVKAAHTGQPGDGIVSVHPVLEVTKIRTGATGLAALR